MLSRKKTKELRDADADEGADEMPAEEGTRLGKRCFDRPIAEHRRGALANRVRANRWLGS
jgi:hypothetical protein